MATVNQVGNSLSGSTGSGTFVGATSPTLVTPELGVATATSINFGGSTLSSYTASTSYTPTISCTTVGNLSVSYATRIGYYVLFGSQCFVNVNLVFTPTYTTASGNLLISLPFTVLNVSSLNLDAMTSIVSSTAFTSTRTQAVVRGLVNTTNAQIQTSGSGVSQATLTLATSFPTATQKALNFSLAYFI